MSASQALSLVEMQRLMKARIRPVATADADQLALAPWLNSQGGEPGVARMAVYVSGYQERFREALAEVYEAAEHIVGAPAFRELATAYAAAYPSHDANLTLVGRSLSQFLSWYPLTKQLPFLPDLARLEWAVCESFHAFDQAPMDAARLTELPLEAWERARLVFQPSVRLVASEWPILDLWQARLTSRDEVSVELAGRAQHVLVSRRGVQVRCELIDEQQHTLLDRLLAGQTIGDALTVCAADPSDAPPLGEWLMGWARAGLIVDVSSE